MQVVAARLPKGIAREIERIAAEEKLDKSSVIARAIDLYIKQWKFDVALRQYEKGKVTTLKAATLAGVSIWEFLEELESRKIPAHYSSEEFIEDFETARTE
jgi:predicted HTH domain antitoxin